MKLTLVGFPTKVTWQKYAISPVWEMRNSVCRLLFLISHSENNEIARSHPSARNFKTQNRASLFFCWRRLKAAYLTLRAMINHWVLLFLSFFYHLAEIYFPYAFCFRLPVHYLLICCLSLLMFCVFESSSEWLRPFGWTIFFKGCYVFSPNL